MTRTNYFGQRIGYRLCGDEGWNSYAPIWSIGSESSTRPLGKTQQRLSDRCQCNYNSDRSDRSNGAHSPKSNFALVQPLLLVCDEGIVLWMLIIMINVYLISPPLVRIHESHCAVYSNLLGHMLFIEIVYRE
jgi:hypothetical protein